MLLEINRNYNNAISKYGDNRIIGTFYMGVRITIWQHQHQM